MAFVVLLCLLLALGGGALVLWRRRKRLLRRVRLAKGRVHPRYPVLLVHGLFGFDELTVRSMRQEYFRGLVPRLEAAGAVVHRPRLPPVSAVRQRAAELARHIEELGASRVNLVAHSMGGLDARFAIAALGLEKQVASLVTLGTPHRGTPIADLGTRLVGDKLLLRPILGACGVGLDAFYDLTCARTAAFNEEVLDRAGIFYGSVVGRADRRGLHPLLVPTHRLLSRAGANDGVVPAASQAWGEVLFEVEADHWAQVGWSKRFDAAALYVDLLRELRALGL